jgi:hypothetical protein
MFARAKHDAGGAKVVVSAPSDIVTGRLGVQRMEGEREWETAGISGGSRA